MWVGRAFFIWTSVFNLFVVSVFWSFMADLFTTEQGKRLFGFIAAAATIGGIVGAGVTASHGAVARRADAAARGDRAARARRSSPRGGWGRSRRPRPRRPSARSWPKPRTIGGGVMAGLTHALRSPYLLNIALYMLLYTVLSTFLYFQQAAIVDASFADRGARRAFFAHVDLLVNVHDRRSPQLFLTGRVMKHSRRRGDADHRARASRRSASCGSGWRRRWRWWSGSRCCAAPATSPSPGRRARCCSRWSAARTSTRPRTSSTPSSTASATRSGHGRRAWWPWPGFGTGAIAWAAVPPGRGLGGQRLVAGTPAGDNGVWRRAAGHDGGRAKPRLASCRRTL